MREKIVSDYIMSWKWKTYFLHCAETETIVLYEGSLEAYPHQKDSSIPFKVYFDKWLFLK